jgi:hypothetical protein
MRKQNCLLKTLSTFGLIVAVVAGVSACRAGSEKWKEEVQLSDGRVIVIDRETIHERGGDEWVHNRSGTKPKERHVKFAALDGSGKAIEWRSTKISPGTWPEKPLLLDVEAGQPMVLASVYVSQACEIYLKYIYRNGMWAEEVLPDKFEPRTTNLLIRDGREMPNFVSLKEKEARNSSLRYSLALRQVGPARKVCG